MPSEHLASTLSPVIATKVRPPHRRGDLMTRPRLVESLSRGLDRKLQVVYAPAGYGKTSLALDFMQTTGVPICWYRIGVAESDIALFLEHLITSLQWRFPGVCNGTLRLMRNENATDIAALMNSLINEIALDIDEKYVLLLDDYQNVDHSADINQAMSAMLTHLPTNTSVMILSRRRPCRLPLVQLAASGDFLELSSNDLRFTDSEVDTLATRLYGESLQEDELRGLREYCEGWVAAIVMGGLPVLVNPNKSAHRSVVDTRNLFDFLMHDVLENESSEIQEFLVSSSILEEMSSELCDVVFTRTDSCIMLQQLVARNLFLQETTGEVTWYRYHQLFHEFLTLRLSDTIDRAGRQFGQAEAIPQLARIDQEKVTQWHRRAAQWYATNGQPAQEVWHLLKAEDLNLAAERMSSTIGDLYIDGRYVNIIRMITALPDATLRSYPLLLHRLSGAYEATGNLDGAIQASDQAVEYFEVLDDLPGLSQALLGRGTWRRMIGDLDLAIADTQRALTLARDDTTRVRAIRNLGQCYILRGDLSVAEESLQEALRCATEDGSPGLIAHTHSDLSMLYQYMGNLERGVDHALAAVNYWQEIGRSGGLALALNNLGTAYHAQGLRHEAERELREAVKQAHLAGIRRLEALALLGLADLSADRDDFAIAESYYERGVRFARESRIVSLHVYGLAMWADVLRLKGDLEQAFQRLMEARAYLTRRSSAYEEALVRYVRGALALDRGDLNRSSRHLDEASNRFMQLGCQREIVRVLLCRAVVAEYAQRQSEADRWWARAETHMAQHGYHAVFDVDLARIARYRAARLRVTGIGYRWIAPTPSAPLHPAHANPAADSLAHRPALSTLTVLALGAPTVILNDEVVNQRAWETMPARDLFFYLIEHPNGCTSDELMMAFWPDSSAKRAKSALHSTLSRVRRALGKGIIHTSNNRYHVTRPEGTTYDLEMFAAHVKRARAADDIRYTIDALAAAVALVRGDYLDGILADWCIERRWSVDREVTQAMLALADARMQAGAWVEAAAVYQRVIDRDALGEVAYQGLMRALAAQGDRASALRVYDGLVKLLDRELGVAPDPQTTSLCAMIRAKRE